jgi:hypothetical protein
MSGNGNMPKAIFTLAGVIAMLVGCAAAGTGPILYLQRPDLTNAILAAIILPLGLIIVAIGRHMYVEAEHLHDTPAKTA